MVSNKKTPKIPEIVVVGPSPHPSPLMRPVDLPQLTEDDVPFTERQQSTPTIVIEHSPHSSFEHVADNFNKYEHLFVPHVGDLERSPFVDNSDEDEEDLEDVPPSPSRSSEASVDFFSKTKV